MQNSTQLRATEPPSFVVKHTVMDDRTCPVEGWERNGFAAVGDGSGRICIQVCLWQELLCNALVSNIVSPSFCRNQSVSDLVRATRMNNGLFGAPPFSSATVQTAAVGFEDFYGKTAKNQ
mmetsp:Transcript_12790/g.29554  ORF Transcript_12790/g.29554 Transcript_12790/m.29554 type:complete len:120 (+) Transcript_12790:2857-3216(+)